VHVLSRCAAALVAVALVSATAAAQANTRPTFGVSAGAAFPTGDFGDGFKSGYEVGVNIGFTPSTMPFGVRFDGAFNQFDAKDVDDVSSKILRVTANAILGSKTVAPGSVRPYAIAGVGVYNVKAEARVGNATVSSSETKLGLNGGAGIDLPLSGISAFLEARYNHVFGDGGGLAFIPLVVGIRF
jgi:opacity protein-like surface antigen